MKTVIALIVAGTVGWGAAILPHFAPVGEQIKAIPNLPWFPPPSVEFPKVKTTVDCGSGEWYAWDIYSHQVTGLRLPPGYPIGDLTISIKP